MERIRVDGAVLADCLFLIGQAWVKRVLGDERGTAEDLAAASALVPPGAVVLFLDMIEDGDLPEPRPDAMDEWLERCRMAGAGDLWLTIGRFPGPPEPPALPPRQVGSEADFLVRLDKIRIDAEARMRAGQAATQARTSAGLSACPPPLPR